MAKKEPSEFRPIEELNKEAADRLRQLRATLSMSRPRLANAIGVNPITIKNYENGYREIGGGLLLRLAQHPRLGKYAMWLLTGQGEEPTADH